MTNSKDDRCTCGIVMPISYIDDQHDEAHWTAVLAFIAEAIERAGMIPQPVWQNADFDVIQAKILRNLFEHELVICDVSTRNPNVMLELGMRLTTKRPTIIIAETGTKLPFDTSIINTEFYDPSLKYGDIAAFVARLAEILTQTRESSLAGTYRAYLELFEFETVKPTSVTISGEEAITDRLDEMNQRIAKLDAKVTVDRSWARAAAFSEPELTGTRAAETVASDQLRSEAQAHTARQAIEVGGRVHHEKFGFGTVGNIKGQQVEVGFETAGSRRVMASFLKPA